MGSQNGIHFEFGGELDQNIIAFNLDREGNDGERFLGTQFHAILQTELFLVERTGDLGSSSGISHQALRQHKGLLVGTHVLRTIPLATVSIVKDRQLRVTVQDGSTDIGGKVRHRSDTDPRLFRFGKHVGIRSLPHGLGFSVLGPIGGTLLTAHIDKFEHVLFVNGLIRVGKLLEFGPTDRILDDFGPFIVIGVDQVRHATIQFVADTEGIFHNDLFQMFNGTSTVLATGQLLLPDRSTFEFIGRQNVIH
mmetsp:Transcript_356/g.886  ORF Transcript_356/g.886 Transcript_356/m.886 type:complete len:250 (-) Transcript_356:844-1593(-)